MGWVHDEGGCSAQNDGTARIARERYLLPGCENPIAVVGKPESFLGGPTGNIPLPRRNSPHPLDPGMLLDAYQADTDGADVALIALYSSDRRFRFPTVNAAPNNGFTWTLDTVDLSYGVPYAVLVTEIVETDIQSSWFDAWKFLDENVYESGQRVRMRFEVKADAVPAALNVMYTRQNKIHRINGEFWLFEGGQLSYAGGGYEMNVSWLREAGVPTPTGLTIYNANGQTAAEQARLKFPRVKSSFPGATATFWTKPPFHKVIMLPNDSGDPADEPQFSPYCNRAYDETGYAAVVALIP